MLLCKGKGSRKEYNGYRKASLCNMPENTYGRTVNERMKIISEDVADEENVCIRACTAVIFNSTKRRVGSCLLPSWN